MKLMTEKQKDFDYLNKVALDFIKKYNINLLKIEVSGKEKNKTLVINYEENN